VEICVAVAVVVAVAGAGWPVVAEKVALAAAEPLADFLVFFFFLLVAGWELLADDSD
jgi:hypothetical protein